MKHYDKYKQDDDREIEDLVTFLPMAMLLTHDGNKIQTGVFNPIYRDRKIYLHLNRSDEQIKTLQTRPNAQLTFFDYLCNIPSHWVDPRYGGAATSYYRFAQFDCGVKLHMDDDIVAGLLQGFLDHYQPEGGYAPLSPESEIYKTSIAMLAIVELSSTDRIAKWKLGQNRSVKMRKKIIEKLRARNQGADTRAADEVVKWMELKGETL